MQSGGYTARFELGLSNDSANSSPSLQFDSQPTVSGGVLLEWLLALERYGAAADIAEPTIRLAQVGWFPQAHRQVAPPVACRFHDRAAVVSIGEAGSERIALVAQVASGKSLTEFPRCAWFAPTTNDVRDSSEFYRELALLGLEVHASARAIERISFGREGARAQLYLGSEQPALAGFLVGPAALDAALHCVLAFARRKLERPVSVWPAMERITVHCTGAAPATLTLRERAGTVADRVVVDLVMSDEAGTELVWFEGIEVGTHAVVESRNRAELTRVFERVVHSCIAAPELSADTPLTALGATSIDLVRISSFVEELLGFTLPLAELLATPTITALVEAYQRAGAPQPLATAAAAPDASALASTERQLWFLERLTNAAGSYNEAFAWTISGPLSIDTLERALQLVQHRHAALRSYFPESNGAPERRLDWRQCSLELMATPDEVRHSPELLQRWIDDVVCRPFAIEHAAPLRCVLLLHPAGEATLVVALHHIVCDAWSFARIFVPELSAAYAALSTDPNATLSSWSAPVTPLPQREPDAAYRAAAETHFRKQLGSVPHILDFPWDHPRPPRQTHRGACLRRPLGAARWSAMKSLARELQVSPFVLCLAAYELLLHRYTRQAEFCVGVPVTLRRGVADERAFGCRVNLSVLRAEVDLASDVRAHCQQVRAALVEMLRFDQLALGDVVRAVQPTRSLSHTPLVQAVFGYRELAGSALAFAGATVTPRFAHNRCAKFDLALALDDFGDDADVSLEFATDLVERSTAGRLLAQYEALLDEIVRRPEAKVGSMSLASASERAAVAAAEQGPVCATKLRSFGAGLIARRAADAVVLRTGSRAWRAADVAGGVAAVAEALRTHGVTAGQFVAVCVPRSAEWVIAVLGILELGAAYVPLDPAMPVARIEHGIARAGAGVVITWGEHELGGDGVEKIELGAVLGASTGRCTGTKRVEADGRAAVYGIMTSGSTGAPRVAAVTLAGFSNLLDWYEDTLQLSAADRVVFATSVGFDLTQKNIFAALSTGAELVIDDGLELDPERLVQIIARDRVTILNCTPSLAYALVTTAAARDLRALSSLRALVLGGEPIDPQALSAWTSHPSCHVRIYNSYGPTECSDVVTACVFGGGRGHDIGSAVPNARCRVIDCTGSTSAIGVPGEIWLSGTPLGLGYLGNAEATAAKFVQHDGATWYRTGDLVRRGERGELLYLGRIDTQVKIRGYRIELSEIETALKLQPGVRDAIVISQPDARGRAMLVGYVVPAHALDGDEQRAFASRQREALARELPSYMVPMLLLPIERVPRTPSGKLDRNALPPLRLMPGAEPLPEIERGVIAKLAHAACSVLGVSALAADADFFEHGGHSLAAIELVSRLEAELGIELRVAALFERPVLSDFAAYLAERVERASRLQLTAAQHYTDLARA